MNAYNFAFQSMLCRARAGFRPLTAPYPLNSGKVRIVPLSPLFTPVTNPHHMQAQTRHMSKYLSKAGKKRIPLTTKRAGKGFYKGKGGTKEGRLTSKGKFVVDPLKRLELVVPDLTGFKVSVTQKKQASYDCSEAS